jgi:general secretion pathway protein I
MGRLTMSSHKQHMALRMRSSSYPQSSRLNLQAGFTLLESLIALAILAIALAAVLRATSASTSHVDALRQRLLADWVAQNRLALHTGRGDWLPVGTQHGEDAQAGLVFIWNEKISSTPNPAFRHIEVDVASAEAPEYTLRHLSGYLVQFPRR